jgi:hypothetical protein
MAFPDVIGFPMAKQPGKRIPVFETQTEPLLSRRLFSFRLLQYFLFGILFLIVSIGIGVLGYHYVGNLSWIDSFLNASMILTGMGPVDRLESDAAKLFASFYAIFSGVAFLTFVAVLFSPVYHRFMHKFHLDLGDKNL